MRIIISGGAGCGKSFAASVIINALKLVNIKAEVFSTRQVIDILYMEKEGSSK